MGNISAQRGIRGMLVLFFRCFHERRRYLDRMVICDGFFFLRLRLYLNYQSSPLLGEIRTQLKPHNFYLISCNGDGC